MSRERVLSKWPHISNTHPWGAPPTTPRQWQPPPVDFPFCHLWLYCCLLSPVSAEMSPRPSSQSWYSLMTSFVFSGTLQLRRSVSGPWAVMFGGETLTLRDSSGGSSDYLRAWKLNSNLLSSSTRNPDQWKCRFCFRALPSGVAYH